MGFLRELVFAFVVILCLHSAEGAKRLRLNARVRQLEEQIRIEALKNSQRFSDLESLIKTNLGVRKASPVEADSVDVEKRLGDMEKDIKDFVSVTTKRSARGLEAKLVKVRRTTAELAKVLNDQRDAIKAMQERLEQSSDRYNDDKASNTSEQNAQCLEAVGKLNDTFMEFRKDVLSQEKVSVTETPTTLQDILSQDDVLVTETPTTRKDIMSLKDVSVAEPTPKPSCQPGWYQLENRCYLQVKNRTTWHSASRDCQNRGGKLAEPKTTEQYDKLINEVIEFGIVWIGGTEEERTGVWVWSENNEPISYSKWYPGQPNNKGGDQHCLGIWNKNWQDVDCVGRIKYICEQAMGK